jgi:T-complex protein 1 subunit theta
LIKYNTGEEDIAKTLVEDIVSSGCQVVIVAASISEMCMHFLELANLVVVRVMSKFELRRVCKLLGATPLVRLGAPTPEETGKADLVQGLEISGHFVTLIKRETE